MKQYYNEIKKCTTIFKYRFKTNDEIIKKFGDYGVRTLKQCNVYDFFDGSDYEDEISTMGVVINSHNWNVDVLTVNSEIKTPNYNTVKRLIYD